MSSLPLTTLFAASNVKKFLERKAVEPGLAFAVELVKHRKPFTSLGVTKAAIPTQVWNLFVELGVTRGAHANVDPMAELLHRRYEIENAPVWRAFFGVEYDHALQKLVQGEKLFHMGRSQWLAYQNSFNHAAFLALQGHLNRLAIPGACKTLGKNGQLVNYGSMLSGSHPFPRNLPVIASALDDANRRRNKLDSSHPYDEKTGRRNMALTKREQAVLVARLGSALREILMLCRANGIG
jgi:hypothetical protein